MSEFLDYDVAVGANFSRYISPYIGAYENEATENNFWPAIDTTDWLDSDLAPFEQYFTLPNNGRYYDFTYGSAHFFVIDASPSEPDGNTATSIQAQWLQAQLMLSTARWKIVVMSYPPYSSDPSAENTSLQWPFDEWGADLVLSGMAMSYERFSVNRFPFIVNGLGGRSLSLPSPQAADSVKLYASNYGAGRLTISPNTMLYEFFAIDGSKVDIFEIKKGKERFMKPPLRSPSTQTPSVSLQLITGAFTNPNGNVLPADITKGAEYNQDPSVTPYNVWYWSVENQIWVQFSAPS